MEYPILRKEILSENVKLMVLKAPHVVRNAKAGQFLIIRVNEHGERIPLTIADFDREAGTVTIIFQEVGASTFELGEKEVGDTLPTVMGPLGHPSEIDNYGTVVCVAGGVGVAPMFPITRALKEAGNRVITIMGARTKDLIFWEDRMREYSDEVIVCTDDGSYGRKALVTEPLKEILEGDAENIAKIWAIGPTIMMKFVSLTTEPFEVPTIVSLNTIMVDGTGMCGGCRVAMKGHQAKFACVDGPEFDGHIVNWEKVMARMTFYKQQEREAVIRYEEEHCRLDKQLAEMSA